MGNNVLPNRVKLFICFLMVFFFSIMGLSFLVNSPSTWAQSLTVTRVNVLDYRGDSKTSFSPTEIAGFFIECLSDTQLGTIRFFYYVRDPSNRTVLSHEGNAIPGTPGYGSSTIKGIPISSFYTIDGTYTFEGKANDASKSISFTVNDDNPEPPGSSKIDLLLPQNGSTTPFESLRFQWSDVGVTRYRVSVDESQNFSNPLWQEETAQTSIDYPRYPGDPRQQLKGGTKYWWKVDGLDNSNQVVVETKEYYCFYVSSPPIHDVAITGISIDPSSPAQGDEVDISYSVKNEGSYGESNIPVNVFVNGAPEPGTIISFLTTGSPQTFTLPFRIPDDATSLRITVSLDFSDDDLLNNSKEKSFSVRPAQGRIDASIQVDRIVGEAGPGSTIIIPIWVNSKANVEHSFVVSCRIENASNGTEVSSLVPKRVNLRSNQRGSQIFSWTVPRDLNAGVYRVRAEVWRDLQGNRLVEEYDEDTESFTVTGSVDASIDISNVGAKLIINRIGDEVGISTRIRNKGNVDHTFAVDYSIRILGGRELDHYSQDLFVRSGQTVETIFEWTPKTADTCFNPFLVETWVRHDSSASGEYDRKSREFIIYNSNFANEIRSMHGLVEVFREEAEESLARYEGSWIRYLNKTFATVKEMDEWELLINKEFQDLNPVLDFIFGFLATEFENRITWILGQIKSLPYLSTFLKAFRATGAGDMTKHVEKTKDYAAEMIKVAERFEATLNEQEATERIPELTDQCLEMLRATSWFYLSLSRIGGTRIGQFEILGMHFSLAKFSEESEKFYMDMRTEVSEAERNLETRREREGY